jgi:hypothetical protein
MPKSSESFEGKKELFNGWVKTNEEVTQLKQMRKFIDIV